MKILILLISVLTLNKTYAFGTYYNPAKTILENSVYPSCKDTKFLLPDDYNKAKTYWKKRCNTGVEKIQILPDNGKIFFNLQNATSSLALLKGIGEKAIAIVNQKILEKEKVLNCFEKNDQKDLNCSLIRRTEIDNVYGIYQELRQELASAEGEEPAFIKKTRGNSGILVFPPVNRLINSSLAKTTFGLQGVFRADDTPPLTIGEKYIVEQKMEAELSSLQFNKDIKNDNDKLQVFRQIRATHKARYFELLQKSPILTVVGKLPEINQGNEINKKFISGYKNLIKLAKEEKAKMENKWLDASVTLQNDPNQIDSSYYKTESDSAKSLLDFMSYIPIVDEVIKDQMKTNPNVCAMAESLYRSMENSNLKSELAKSGALVGGAVVITVVTGGAGALILPEMIPFVGGLGLTAQTAAAIALGPGLGFIARQGAQDDLNATKGAVFAGLKGTDDLEAADTNVVLGNATFGLDYVGSGLFKTSGNAIYKAVAKNALKSEGLELKEAEKLIKISQSTNLLELKEAKLAQERIKNSIKKRFEKMFPESKPTEEELEALVVLEATAANNSNENIKDFFNRIQNNIDRKEKKQTLIEAIKLIKLQNPEKYQKMSPQELKDLNRHVIAISRYGEIKDPEKIAAILSEWDIKSKNNLTTILEEAKKILDDKKFNVGKNLKERRELAFKNVLEKHNVKDEASKQEMCICTNICTGGGKISLELYLNQKKKLKHICAMNDQSVWY